VVPHIVQDKIVNGFSLHEITSFIAFGRRPSPEPSGDGRLFLF